MNQNATVLVLGAYGLAGRAIVERLLEKSSCQVVASGRDPAKLRNALGSVENARLHFRILDALDASALCNACADAHMVINAVGPFARNGADIARIVLESGKPYLDCANEQQHYRRLQQLDDIAKSQNVPMITGAGAIPGISTLVAAQCNTATEIHCCWAQLRHAYPESGLASMMGGLLEALAHPVTIVQGEAVPVVLGASVRSIDFPEPFGRRTCLELPTIDALTLPDHVPVQDYHTWFFLGDLPLWLLAVVRLMQPQRRAWAYRIMEAVMRNINTRDTKKAIASGVGPEAMLLVTASGDDAAAPQSLLFKDGAAATACLPVHLAQQYLQGAITQTGLLTPLDLVSPESVMHIVSDVLL